MDAFRTDLAMERTVGLSGTGRGVSVETSHDGALETTWIRIKNEEAARRLGKAQGNYWTMIHPQLPTMLPEERMRLSGEIAGVIRTMLPERGEVLVLGLGNRRMTADALGDRVVSGILVTRHHKQPGLRSVCALSPGVLGVTGVETAELAIGITERVNPAAVIVVDALAAMEMGHIGTTVQVTDTGICPGSGVGNHRRGITASMLHRPVIAVGIPMVVYASTIVRDALRNILARDSGEDAAEVMAQNLAYSAFGDDLVVTPRSIDEMVQGLADMLALAINSALQPSCTVEELSHFLH